MRKIISFSIWGSNPMYCKGVIRNIELAKEVYPGWICRVYYNKSVPVDLVNEAAALGAEMVLVDQPNSWDGLGWRFLAVNDCDADVVIVRDADSRLNVREKAAVDEWLLSDYHFHCMRDNREHNVSIMGGMWGCRTSVLPKMAEMVSSYRNKAGKGWDQDFLNLQIWPNVRDTALCHDKYNTGMWLDRENVVHINEKPDSRARYVYDPMKFFGLHEIRPFPKHAECKYQYVGEIVKDDL